MRVNSILADIYPHRNKITGGFTAPVHGRPVFQVYGLTGLADPGSGTLPRLHYRGGDSFTGCPDTLEELKS
ncbi:MAG: hypothetical protein D4R68_01110 [Ignavibacteriales bacterium]|nr:MAG: hypothetical protein D4R68_01110 [Ignavibacteriales bacterium]